jgi:DNA helicase-2/ATP-dependent DNA helicase PcrA
MSSKVDFDTLNPQQLEAVEHPSGPLLVFAGAGSGKTRVITYRIARLIEMGISPRRILAVTFTNKAAEEMKARVSKLSGEDARTAWVGTFHATCARILREAGQNIGVDSKFVVYDTDDQLALIRGILKSLQLDDKEFTPRSVLNTISRAKEKLISPEDFDAHHYGYFDKICGKIYGLYQVALAQNRALDFDDLIYYTVRLFEQRPEVLDRYQDRFEHVLVDEFQDVNLSQYKLIRMLGDKHRNICIVGDDDQSIYMFRGADVSLILRFSKDYPDAKTIRLEQNYRSTQRILDAAHHVVKHNKGRAPKKLWTDNPEGAPLTVTEVGTEQEEAMVVAQTILQEVGTGKRSWKDFAVLYRTNAQSRAMEDAFVMMRIKHKIVGSLRFYERKEIKDLLAYLRLVMNPHDSVSLQRVINVPTRGVGSASVAQVSNYAHEHEFSWWDALHSQELTPEMTNRAQKSLGEFVKLIEDLREMPDENGITPRVREIISRTGYIESLKKEDSQEALSRIENVKEFVTVTTDFDENADDKTLVTFLQNVSLVSDIDTYDDASDMVTMMTVHTVKGLEYPVVFMVGMEEGLFPHQRAMTSDTELEEERRLCYVGMTRSKEELHLTHAYRRTLYGYPTIARRSRFLDHLPKDSYLPIGSSAPPAASRVVERDWRGTEPFKDPHHWEEPAIQVNGWDSGPVMPFAVSEKVKHAKFGIGVVVACQKTGQDFQVTVAFPGVIGIKKLLQSIAKLEALG